MATPLEEGSTTRGRGRPRRQEADAAAALWNDEDVRMLFALRYNTMTARFDDDMATFFSYPCRLL
ncbi:hypothetical protein GQ600_15712 [Phytophthora cactorum]|nr:hypothetical protein GQ600_15712 [Phytophthora cactorum]